MGSKENACIFAKNACLFGFAYFARCLDFLVVIEENTKQQVNFFQMNVKTLVSAKKDCFFNKLKCAVISCLPNTKFWFISLGTSFKWGWPWRPCSSRWKKIGRDEPLNIAAHWRDKKVWFACLTWDCMRLLEIG